MKKTFATIAEIFSRALMPFHKALTGTDDHLIQYFQKLGWALPEAPQALKDLQSTSNQLTASVARLENWLRHVNEGSASENDLNGPVAEFLLDFALFMSTIRGLSTGLRAQLPAEFVAATRIDAEIHQRIFNDALSRHLEYDCRDIYLIARVLGIVESVRHDADPGRFQPEFEERRIRWDRIPQIVSDPAALMREVYGWGTPALDSAKLLLALRDLSFAFLAPAFFDYAARALLRATIPELPETVPPARGLRIPFLTGSPLELFLGLYPLPKRQPDEPQGLILTLAGLAGVQESLEITPSLALNFNSQIDLASGIALAIWPDRPPKILGNIGTAAGSLVEGASATVGFSYSPPEQSERVPLLSFTGFQLDAGALSMEAGVGGGANAAAEAYVQANLPRMRLQLGGLGQDSFLKQLLPDSLVLEFDLCVGWSITEGLYWRNGAGPRITIPVSKRIGPVEVDSLEIAIASSGETFQAVIGVSAGSQLGPVFVRVQGLGGAFALDFQGGNLGPVDLGFSAVPPKRIGLAIDALGVSGGGDLYLDGERGQYSGFVQLDIEGRITVKGLGLISTRLPGGTPGFSFVIIVTAEGFKPIPLPLGFRLTGIGGLLAINRTFDEEALRAGLRNRTLDSVLFPHDPIRNAPQILSNLNTVFPPADGHHLFGPVAQIEWGTPTLITADLAVVLELGARQRLLILARIAAILPKPENDLLRLQTDAVGVLDFDQGTAALDATLYDSRLLKKFVLTGDMAMRLKWEPSPNFALAVGGLHPAFNPPPNFPRLERIALNLTAGDNPRFRCEAYFALTANTVQFGARAELYAAASGFSIQGETGFDVLIQLDPFYFLADYYAQVQLKRGSTNLFKVRVEGALAGPRPLHIKGKATFEVLWWEVSIRFDKTLVEGEKPPPPEPVNLLPRLKEALGHPGNWTGRLPDGQRPMVTLRARAAAPTEVLLHPLGTLAVKQSIVPLDMEISRFGQAPPAGARRFTITSVSLGGQNQTTQPVNDFFAPAQFFEMSDDEKLSSPSFEAMAAGVSIGSDEFAFSADENDWLEVEAIKFETITIDKERNETRRSGPADLYALSPELLGRQARFGAAGVSDIRRTGKAKYRTTMGKLRIAKEAWSIVATDDLTVRPVPGIEAGRPTTYSEAAQALSKLKQADPAKASSFKILRLSEVRVID